MFNFPAHSAQVFKNKFLQQELEEYGYVIIPFYNEKETKLLTSFYQEHTQKNVAGFQPTTYAQSEDYRMKASSIIKEIGIPILDKYFENYKTYMGSFIVKYPDKNSELGVHQDMSLVDESKFMGINVWSPLCDTTEQNGALYLIQKSHRIFPTYRNATITNIYDKEYDLIKKYMQAVYLKAGEAIIFDNSILHYSPANQSNSIRIATNIFITHRDARITISFHDKEKNKIELFEEEDNFFTQYQQFTKPSNLLRPKIGKSIGYFDYNFPSLTPQVLEERYGKIKSDTIFAKFKKLISR
ncbi:MAG: phytanoyl-CoA dioxygenase family protein [Chitinophagaceae bacterium]|nr:phytanoyl-CoA dioxygenase family protein [Chitinophagaceae bacterium]